MLLLLYNIDLNSLDKSLNIESKYPLLYVEVISDRLTIISAKPV